MVDNRYYIAIFPKQDPTAQLPDIYFQTYPHKSVYANFPLDLLQQHIDTCLQHLDFRQLPYSLLYH